VTESDLQQMASALRKAGYRLTRARKTILRVLHEGEKSLSPAEIWERGRLYYDKLGLVTVYRTLDTMMQLGLVQRVHGVHNCHNYVSTEQRTRHHLVCQRCGQVSEFTCHGLENLIEVVQQETGFAVSEHVVELIGFCAACQRQIIEGQRTQREVTE